MDENKAFVINSKLNSKLNSIIKIFFNNFYFYD